MYKNSEGYASPTEGTVVANLMKEYRQKRKAERERTEAIKGRKTVYVVSPYAGDIAKNVQKAKAYCRFVIGQNGIPIASHLLYPVFLRDSNPKERELGRLFGLALLALCREVWVFGTDFSAGMRAEIHEAKIQGKPIRYFDERMEPIHEND